MTESFVTPLFPYPPLTLTSWDAGRFDGRADDDWDFAPLIV